MTPADLIDIQKTISDHFSFGRPLRMYWHFREDHSFSAGIAFTLRIEDFGRSDDLETTVVATNAFMRDTIAEDWLEHELITAIQSCLDEERT